MKSSSPRWFSPEALLLWMLLAAVLGIGSLLLSWRISHASSPALGLAGRPRIQWLPPTDRNPYGHPSLQHIVADRFDPTVMSLPHPQGFSGKIWKHGVPLSPQPTDWPVSPSFLASPAAAPPAPVLLPPPALDREVQAAAQKPVASAENAPPTEAEASIPANRTVIRIANGFTDRRVLEWPSPGAVRSKGMLRPTRIQVAVGPDGRVRFAIVERPSGDPALDGHAVELARQIRFEPRAEAESLQWGVLRFLWAQATDANGGSS